MGRMNALGMNEAVEDGLTSLRAALSWHLTCNHFPPLPSAWVDGAIEAIDAANEEDWDREITLPAAAPFAEQVHTAGHLVEAMHLDAYLDDVEY